MQALDSSITNHYHPYHVTLLFAVYILVASYSACAVCRGQSRRYTWMKWPCMACCATVGTVQA